MSWVKQSDKLWSDYRFNKLTDGAQALWHRANSWIADQLTDGEIPPDAQKLIGARRRYIDELVASGYWDCLPAGGWLSVGWREIIKSREDVTARRNEESQRLRAKRCNQLGKVLAPPVPVPVPREEESLQKPIKETNTTTTQAGLSHGGGDWVPKSAGEAEKLQRAAEGHRWFEALKGGQAPALMSWQREYEKIGSFPASERLQVARNIQATQWCADNRSLVTPGHVVKYWDQYAAGPRNLKPGTPQASPVEAARERFKAAEKAYRDAERYGEPVDALFQAWNKASQELEALKQRAS